MTVFHDAADHMSFLAMVAYAVGAHDVVAHAYVVMDNHFHLIATPGDSNAIPRMMKDVAGRYVRYYNRRYGRIGTPLNGRYGAKIIGDERYWLTCLRYVEQNPVEAQLVSVADDYRWSSYAAHAWGQWPVWLVPHPVYLALGRSPAERETAYRAVSGIALTDDELALIRCPLPAGSSAVAQTKLAAER